MANYQYNITDFSNDIANVGRLHQEINESSINTTISGVTVDSGVCYLEFAGTLSGTEPATLSGIVTGHTGEIRMITSFQEEVVGYMSTSSTDYQVVTSGTIDSIGEEYNITVNSEVSCNNGLAKLRIMCGDEELSRSRYNPGTEEGEFAPYSNSTNIMLEVGTHVIMFEYAANNAQKPLTIQNTQLLISRRTG